MGIRNKLLYSLTTLTFALFSILKQVEGGYYWLALAVSALFSVGVIRNKKIVLFAKDEYFRYLLLFVIVGLLSNFWTVDKSLTWKASTNMLRMWFVLNLMYCSTEKIPPQYLFRSIMWGGSIYIIFMTFHVGIGEIMVMSQMGERVNSELFNANAMGMLAAVVVVICYSSFIHKGLSYDAIAGFIGLFAIMITVSRKAFVMLVLGVLMVYLQKNQIKSIVRISYKIIVAGLIAAVLLLILFDTPIFSTYAERLTELVGFFSKSGEMTHSDWARKTLIEAGWQQFLKTPFTGLGLDCGRTLSVSVVGYYYYLHNNYVELLADVGVFGFLSYYLIHIIFIIKMIKCYGKWTPAAKIAFPIIIMYLVADWGSVSYYNKEVLFIYMVCYKSLLEVENGAKCMNNLQTKRKV